MLARLGRILGAVGLGVVLVASTYGAHAAKPPAPATHDHYAAPVPHQYRADGLRMGLHCETASMAMP
jgi:hypothetical protein